MNLKWLFAGYGSMVLVLLMLSPVLAQVDVGPITAEGTVEAGGITEPVPYNDVAKYQEYRDLAQQLIVPQLRLLLGDKDGDYYARFDAVGAAQKNQMYTLRFGEYGKLDVQVQCLEIPHYFSDQVASTPYSESGGDFTLSSKPASVAKLASWLQSNAKPFDMSLLEGIANVNVRYTPTPSLTFNANMNYQNPTGEQPFGGSFLFGANPGSYKVNELWVPTQYYTYNFGAGMEYAKNGWLLGFQYQGSFFLDAYDTLTWDNPLNLTGIGSACKDSTTFTSTSTTGPCQGRAAMYPDNQAHNFIVTGAGQLPFNTHVMGSLEYGFWLQDAPFIPLTINSKLQQSLSSVGAPSSLGGDVRPFFVNFTIDSNPIKPLELKATYSYFDYDNQTPSIKFTGVKSLNDVPPETPSARIPSHSRSRTSALSQPIA